MILDDLTAAAQTIGRLRGQVYLINRGLDGGADQLLFAAALDSVADIVQVLISFPAFGLVIEERLRQTAKGFHAAHDDLHRDASLISAAICYAASAYSQHHRGLDTLADLAPMLWPWNQGDWKPSADPQQNLLEAAAMLLAEIERRQRAAARKESEVAA